ncbi:MAG: hypothetical protein V7K68_32905 [Nostoc sp.]
MPSDASAMRSLFKNKVTVGYATMENQFLLLSSPVVEAARS